MLSMVIYTVLMTDTMLNSSFIGVRNWLLRSEFEIECMKRMVMN